MEKLYDRIDWHNNTSPALNETNLNRMSKAVDDIDDRVVDIAGTVMETVPQIQEDLAEAQELLEDAEEISTHPPIIGQNGNWWVWDTNIDDYADSGVDAGVSLSIGSTTTLPAGSDATVTNTGTATDPVLNFGIPQGEAGQTGAGVPTGGTTGQVLAKASGTDYDTEWITPSGGSGGHTILNGSGTAMSQRGKLQFDGLDVTDDSGNDKTVVKSPIFNGTTAQWEALSSAEKAKYTVVNLTDDYGNDWERIYSSPDVNVSSTYNITTVSNLSIDTSQYKQFEAYVYIKESQNGPKICVLKISTKEIYNFNGSTTGYDATMSAITRYIYGAVFLSTSNILTGYQIGAKWNGNVYATIDIYGKRTA